MEKIIVLGDTSIQFIKDFEENKIYSFDIFNNTKYVR